MTAARPASRQSLWLRRRPHWPSRTTTLSAWLFATGFLGSKDFGRKPDQPWSLQRICPLRETVGCPKAFPDGPSLRHLAPIQAKQARLRHNTSLAAHPRPVSRSPPGLDPPHLPQQQAHLRPRHRQSHASALAPYSTKRRGRSHTSCISPCRIAPLHITSPQTLGLVHQQEPRGSCLSASGSPTCHVLIFALPFQALPFRAVPFRGTTILSTATRRQTIIAIFL